MSNKEITIEDLARMVQNGFNELRTDINVRFDDVDKRLENVELKLTNVAYRFDVQDLERRVQKLEQLAGVKANA